MLKNFKINFNILHGSSSLKELPKILDNYNFKQIILICDKKIMNLNYIKRNTNFIKKKFYLSFNEEPTYQQLDQEIIKIKKIKKIDCIIALGGGSTIDFAKAIAILLRNKGKSLKFMGFPKNLKNVIPVIAVPTTVSTGSEIIYNAVFTDKISNIKLGINYEKNYPILSVLDSKLISSAPKKVIYQSAIASLMRSIETYTSPDSDEITRFFSKRAYSLISSALKNKKNKNFYRDLQWGCVFSMIALSNSSSGPSGVINYYLSTNYKIAQPFSYSFTALEFIKHNIKNRYYGYCGLIDDNKIKDRMKAQIFLKDLIKTQKLLSVEIIKTKNKIKKKDDVIEEILNIFQTKKFIPLKKNPIKIKKNQLKNILNKIIN
jgi:alcohol dehydrogenase